MFNPESGALLIDERAALAALDAHRRGEYEPVLVHELIHAAQRGDRKGLLKLPESWREFEDFAAEGITDLMTADIVHLEQPELSPFGFPLVVGAYGGYAATVSAILTAASEIAGATYYEVMHEFATEPDGARLTWTCTQLVGAAGHDVLEDALSLLLPVMKTSVKDDFFAATHQALALIEAAETAVRALCEAHAEN